MTVNDAKSAIKALKNQGFSDDQIVVCFCRMFIDDKIDFNALNALVNLMGNHLSEDLVKMSTKEQKKYLMKALGLK